MVIIYGKDACPWCVKAKNLAISHQLKHEYRNIGYTEHRESFDKDAPDAKTVPQIFWHGRHIGGYEEFAKECEETLGTNFADDLF